jgi:hypothetical protein
VPQGIPHWLACTLYVAGSLIGGAVCLAAALATVDDRCRTRILGGLRCQLPAGHERSGQLHRTLIREDAP